MVHRQNVDPDCANTEEKREKKKNKKNWKRILVKYSCKFGIILGLFSYFFCKRNPISQEKDILKEKKNHI